MKWTLQLISVVLVLCVVFSVSAFADEPTWEDYQAYLVEAAGGNAPDLAEFQGQVDSIGSWDEIPMDESPWDMLFSMLGISTWDEFVAAGGVGAPSKESGSDEMSGEASGEPSGEASGEPSGEASGEPSGEASGEPSGEASGEPSGEASGEPSGEASGEPSGEPSDEAAGDTSEEAYHAYLKEFVDAVPAVNDEQFLEFAALIDASDYETMPADMMFNPQWWGYAAMTYDEFVEAGGIYEIPAFDPGLVPD